MSIIPAFGRHGELEASLGYITRPGIKTNNKKIQLHSAAFNFLPAAQAGLFLSPSASQSPCELTKGRVTPCSSQCLTRPLGGAL
jgi:hypothetical protein